ncbi:MAG: hypothetical protein SPE11_05370 [Parabacteroides sp.]|nr:hypothetical protein [Parabacteroides sp.]
MAKTTSFTALSFAGTVFANSYNPVFLLEDGQSEATNLVTGLGHVIKPTYAQLNTNILLAGGQGTCFRSEAIDLFSSIGEFFTRRKEKDWINKQIDKLVANAKEEFQLYTTKHEELLVEIQDDLERINIQKVKMKEMMLRNLYEQLKSMGLQVSWNDARLDRIDLRKFPLHEQYNLSRLHLLSYFDDISKVANNIVLVLDTPLYLLSKLFTARLEVKQLQDELEILQKQQSYNSSQMNADLTKLSKLEMALKNVANIYSDIVRIVLPIFEKLLHQLVVHYCNSLELMPVEKVNALQRIKDILKSMAERQIIPNRDMNLTVTKVIEYSNEMSMKHTDLKAEILAVS